MRWSDHSPRPIKPAPRPERQAACRVDICRKSRRRFPDRKGIPHSGAALEEPPRRNRYRRTPASAHGIRRVKARTGLDEAAESVNER
jgi:hypothetical protein